eukprot:Hpha_TRINITY_DN16018_c4_g3::TRINITY_DN16018_c4_g3_i1::g.118216::m.118216/K15104/SLC25A11, OGC; solute carrier family 25 (mitochondrial oxoglutarate transporter), member 11
MSGSAAMIGGLAAMTASTITHPADSLKVRMFLHGEGQSAKGAGTGSLVKDIYRSEGLRRGFFRGVTATWLRQALFSTSRFGVNDAMQAKLSGGKGAKALSVGGKIASAGVAGGVAASLSCPADMILVRMQADGRLPVTERRGYRNVFHGLRKVYVEEGATQLYRGLCPLVMRGVCVTAGQFTTYDVAKRSLMERFGHGDGIRTHLLASTMAGTVSTLIVNPLDVIKSRMMQSRSVPVSTSTTLRAYTSDLDCVRMTWRAEGVRGFYKGLPATFMRQCPQVVLMWVIFEQYKRVFANMYTKFSQ